jgi:hypothetical protein
MGDNTPRTYYASVQGVLRGGASGVRPRRCRMACALARAKTRGWLEEGVLNPNPFPMSRIP